MLSSDAAAEEFLGMWVVNIQTDIEDSQTPLFLL
jgi:hypothetical protein